MFSAVFPEGVKIRSNGLGGSMDSMEAAARAALSRDEWDAQAELTVAMTIRRFIATYPPPAESLVAFDLAAWAENLQLDAQARLAELAARPLRLVPPA